MQVGQEMETPQGTGLTPASFQKLCGDLEALIRVPDQEYSDLTIVTDGKTVPVHRCILAVRCPGLRKAFAEMEQIGGSKLELELSSVVPDGKIGYEAFVAVMGYVYGGKMEPWPALVPCYDPSCSHLTCRPAIDYVLEVLRASLLLTLPEVKAVAEVCQPWHLILSHT
jgi:regulatory protein NPR1